MQERHTYVEVPVSPSETLRHWTCWELRQELLIWLEIDIGVTQLFEWFRYALIPVELRDGRYTERDRRKLLIFASAKKRFRLLKHAQQELLDHMRANPGHYPPDI